MTRSDLLELFVRNLTRQIGGNRRRWRAVIGEIRIYGIDTHSHCNWAINPIGGAGENAAIERLADHLRGEHPIIKD